MLDYEGELTVIIARDAKNVTEDEALDYVLGYTVGNDVSARNFQLQDASGGQVGYSKSFDHFAPIGPAVFAARLIPDPQDLHYITRVNGEVRQDTQTKNMIWSVRQIIAHLTRGRTLRQGTVIMTGTDAGMGWYRGSFLNNGDVVEVEIDGIGKIANTMIYT
jgi:2-keto-4-pentenoate hydratase/2-oxohepta-3-ene-1,7-dioic acid hydratase in catechol pathway